MRYFIIVLLLMTSSVHAACYSEDDKIQEVITRTDPVTGEVTKKIVTICLFPGNALDALTEKLEKEAPKGDFIYPVYRCGIDGRGVVAEGGVLAACK